MRQARSGFGAAWVDDRKQIVAVGGRTSTARCGGGELDTAERYDPSTNQWTELPPLPSPRSDLAVVALGGYVYAIGGCDRNETTGDVVVLGDVLMLTGDDLVLVDSL